MSKPRRPIVTRAVIEALGAVRSTADIECDSSDDLTPERRKRLERGIQFIDELRHWFIAKNGESKGPE